MTVPDQHRLFLDEVVNMLQSSKYCIRFIAMGGSGGGYCTIRGKETVYLDTDSPVYEQLQVACEALLQAVDIESVYLKPGLRDLIEKIDSDRRRFEL